LFFSCRPSDRFALFIGELQAQAGIVDPIDGFFFLYSLLSQRQNLLFSCVCRPSNRSFIVNSSILSTFFLLIGIGELQAPAGIVDPIDGSSFGCCGLFIDEVFVFFSCIRRSHRRSSFVIVVVPATLILLHGELPSSSLLLRYLHSDTRCCRIGLL